MAAADMENHRYPEDRDTSPPDTGTLYDQQRVEAEDPNSSAYSNGRKPFPTTRGDFWRSEESMSHGERIQEEVEGNMYKRGGPDSVRKTWREVEDTAWTRWVKRWLRGNKQKKKGTTNPKY